MAIFDSTNPANTQGAKLGALRMREIKAILDLTLGRLFSLSPIDSTSGTVAEVANSVSGTMLKQHASDDAQRAVDANHIKTNAVTATKIATDAVGSGAIAANAVTTVKILDANVTTAKIADLGVTTPKLADSAATQAKLANNEVTSEKFTRPKKWVRLKKVALGTGELVRTGGSLVTATIAGHGLRVGDTFVVYGTSPADFSGTFTVGAVTSASVFTYTSAGANGANGAATDFWVSFAGTSHTLTGSADMTITANRSGTTVTITTWDTHGLLINDRVRISGMATASLNGEFTVLTVPDANGITYATVASGSAGPETGTGQKLARDVASFTASDPGGRAVVTMTLAVAMPDSDFGLLTTVGDTTATFDFTVNSFINSSSLVTLTINETGGETDLPEQLTAQWIS